MSGHHKHAGNIDCVLADSYLHVIGALEEHVRDTEEQIQMLKAIVRRDALEHLKWRAALLAASGKALA